MNPMWQRNSAEAVALRSQHGSSESRRGMRQKLRTCSSMLEDYFAVTLSYSSVSALTPPPDPISDQVINDGPMSQTSTASVGDAGDTLEASTQPLQGSNAILDQRPGLLRLPLELRQQIYGYLFPHNDQHMLQTKRQDMPIPNFVIKHSKDSEHSRYWDRDFERVGANTAIMRLNKKLHFETRDYLFRNSIIKIDVNEDGYSFLENRSGGNHVSWTRESGRTGEIRDVASVNPIPRDRDAEWHQKFLSNFDFTLPKKLIISIEAASHENPKEVVQIRESMTSLCNMLRKCSEIRSIEVLMPLAILRNVSEMSVQLPRSTASLEIISAKIDSICDRAKGKTSLPVATDIAENDRLTKECRQRLKAVEMRKKIKKAERTKAKDQWYRWHCETCGEEFTDHGEQGYESSDDADW